MKNIFKALADFQDECPIIIKNTQGYGYVFADLPEIVEIIKPLLKTYGLGYTQPLHGNQIKTILFHVESGETIESLTDIPQGVKLSGQNDFQVLGSAITYLRRYSLCSILGLVTEKDTDASGEQNKAKPEPKTNDVKVTNWMDETKYKEALSDKDKAFKALGFYDGKTNRKGKIYGMKKEYRNELLKIKDFDKEEHYNFEPDINS